MLLSDINESKRKYGQETWGEIESYCEDLNICNTPMCIAGHFVHMAGESGYRLKNIFGWATAAGLLHIKSSPNTPIFNYTNTSNEAGMAYIEMMAAFENRENLDQSFDEFIGDILK